MHNKFKLPQSLIVGILISLWASFYPSIIKSEEVGRTTSPLTSASNDANTPFANSTVWLGNCTGTLITPDIVLTAGHCGFHNDPAGRNPNQWVPVSRPVTVSFGNNRTSAVSTITARFVNISGSEDIVMLGLSSSVPPSVAIPRKPLTRMPHAASRDPRRYWRPQTFQLAGWGGTNTANTGPLPTIRQITNVSNGDLGCRSGTRNINQICVGTSRSGSYVRGGDSGGPLYWTNPESRENFVIGAVQGFGPSASNSAESHSTVTFGGPLALGRGAGGAPIGITLGEWIENATRKSFCAIRREQIEQTARVRRLYLWWSPGREDNFTTANPTWAGCDRDRDRSKPDYNFSRVEGVIFAPNSRQSGTIPLYSWWHQGRGDNFITSNPRWRGSPGTLKEGYRFVRLEGYIYDPERPQPRDTKPLYSWWSPGRGDNFATSHSDWAPSSRASHGDYRYYRLEGYVRRP